ncbi:hypothetical protein K469DRAFT_695043 [Zopfia rhizophila CBS 207.26]|uniref:Uncharacterized protein n=1 Tax=Zopfia rhizophila CBS 207.26 TaxID=1314779 RepID=A0A6A6DJP0_9PEZI|nr:hypothetical protein K469DRAFT_695043 [Zopfia rhizophila CBS 207.26]
MDNVRTSGPLYRSTKGENITEVIPPESKTETRSSQDKTPTTSWRQNNSMGSWRPKYTNDESPTTSRGQGDSMGNLRPKYTNDETDSILYLRIILDKPWNETFEMFQAKYGDRTTLGLQAKTYRKMREWGMLRDTEQKGKNRALLRKKISKSKMEKLEKLFGLPF